MPTCSVSMACVTCFSLTSRFACQFLPALRSTTGDLSIAHQGALCLSTKRPSRQRRKRHTLQTSSHTGLRAVNLSDASAMFVLGLTGSIGMGKSTVSSMFLKHGVPVMDSDAVVHDLYDKEGAAVEPIGELFPDAVVDGGVDRKELGKFVIGNEDGMKKLEELVHPLVEQERIKFLKKSMADGSALVVLDIPLLYETKTESKVDSVAVVSAGAAAQKERVLARPGMTEEKFNAILQRQVPDSVKRERAQHIIDTNLSMTETEEQVVQLISDLSSKEGTVMNNVLQ